MADRLINETDVIGALETSTTGNFFSDDGGNIIKLGDRVFIGDAVTQDGAAVPAQRTWVGLEANGYLTYLDTRSTVENISPNGGVAYVGATRTSDNPAGLTNVPIAYVGLARNDVVSATPSDRNGTWSFYGLSVRDPDSGTDISGSAQVCEFHVVNKGSVIDTNPYVSLGATSGVTYGTILGSGGEYSQSGDTVNDASAAIHIAGGNGAKFRKGINISSGGLSGTDGSTGTGDAINMAKGHQVVWFYSGADDARGLTIRSDCSDINYSTKIVGTSTGLRFYDQFENTLVRILPDQTVASGDGTNSLIFRNAKAATGNGYIQGTGSDTNVGVDIVGQNRSQHNFYSYSKTRLMARFVDVGTGTGSTTNVLFFNSNDSTADPYISAAGAATNVNVGVQGKGTGGFFVKDGGAATKLSINTTGVGFFAATPVAKQTLSAALSTGGSETNTNIATAINAIRTALINYGLAS